MVCNKHVYYTLWEERFKELGELPTTFVDAWCHNKRDFTVVLEAFKTTYKVLKNVLNTKGADDICRMLTAQMRKGTQRRDFALQKRFEKANKEK